MLAAQATAEAKYTMDSSAVVFLVRKGPLGGQEGRGPQNLRVLKGMDLRGQRKPKM